MLRTNPYADKAGYKEVSQSKPYYEIVPGQLNIHRIQCGRTYTFQTKCSRGKQIGMIIACILSLGIILAAKSCREAFLGRKFVKIDVMLTRKESKDFLKSLSGQELKKLTVNVLKKDYSIQIDLMKKERESNFNFGEAWDKIEKIYNADENNIEKKTREDFMAMSEEDAKAYLFGLEDGHWKLFIDRIEKDTDERYASQTQNKDRNLPHLPEEDGEQRQIRIDHDVRCELVEQVSVRLLAPVFTESDSEALSQYIHKEGIVSQAVKASRIDFPEYVVHAVTTTFIELGDGASVQEIVEESAKKISEIDDIFEEFRNKPFAERPENYQKLLSTLVEKFFEKILGKVDALE